MIRALLIDDEKNALTALRMMLEQFCPQVTVVGESQSAMEGLLLIRKHVPDVLFLDVEMPGGTGFDLLDAVSKKEFAIIFTTAHEQYTIPAIRAGAVDYLLKPINMDELRKAVERLDQLIGEKQALRLAPDTVTISNSDGTWFVSASEILCVEAAGRYSRFYLTEKRQYVISKNLGEVEEEIAQQGFFRVHKSWLVNCSHVMHISNSDGGFAILSDKREIEISRRKRSEFMRLMERT